MSSRLSASFGGATLTVHDGRVLRLDRCEVCGKSIADEDREFRYVGFDVQARYGEQARVTELRVHEACAEQSQREHNPE